MADLPGSHPRYLMCPCAHPNLLPCRSHSELRIALRREPTTREVAFLKAATSAPHTFAFLRDSEPVSVSPRSLTILGSHHPPLSQLPFATLSHPPFPHSLSHLFPSSSFPLFDPHHAHAHCIDPSCMYRCYPDIAETSAFSQTPLDHSRLHLAKKTHPDATTTNIMPMSPSFVPPSPLAGPIDLEVPYCQPQLDCRSFRTHIISSFYTCLLAGFRRLAPVIVVDSATLSASQARPQCRTCPTNSRHLAQPPSLLGSNCHRC